MPMWVIYTEFPVGAFAERLRANHPEWKDMPRQWYNCIRWQGTARKQHKKDILEFQEIFPTLHVDQNPEALGVNVTDIMRQIGIDLEWNYHLNHDPKRLTYRVSIAGTRHGTYDLTGKLVEPMTSKDVEIVKRHIDEHQRSQNR